MEDSVEADEVRNGEEDSSPKTFSFHDILDVSLDGTPFVKDLESATFSLDSENSDHFIHTMCNDPLDPENEQDENAG